MLALTRARSTKLCITVDGSSSRPLRRQTHRKRSPTCSRPSLHRLFVGRIVDIDRFKPCVAPKDLRRLPEGTEERPSHMVAVAEPGLARHHIDRVAALLHERARTLDPKIFDSLGRRLTRFRMKGAAELTGAQMRGLGKVGVDLPRKSGELLMRQGEFFEHEAEAVHEGI